MGPGDMLAGMLLQEDGDNSEENVLDGHPVQLPDVRPHNQ